MLTNIVFCVWKQIICGKKKIKKWPSSPQEMRKSEVMAYTDLPLTFGLSPSSRRSSVCQRSVCRRSVPEHGNILWKTTNSPSFMIRVISYVYTYIVIYIQGTLLYWKYIYNTVITVYEFFRSKDCRFLTYARQLFLRTRLDLVVFLMRQAASFSLPVVPRVTNTIPSKKPVR
jgi:hypothetical protein